MVVRHVNIFFTSLHNYARQNFKPLFTTIMTFAYTYDSDTQQVTK